MQNSWPEIRLKPSMLLDSSKEEVEVPVRVGPSFGCIVDLRVRNCGSMWSVMIMIFKRLHIFL